jgi:phosphoglycerate kinase
MIKKIQEADLENRKVLLRADFNVAVENGKAKERFKIEAVKETLEYLLEKNCKIALLSHLGRPDGKINPDYSLKQIKDDIENISGAKIVFVDDCISEKKEKALDDLKKREVVLLENARFYPEEEKNDGKFAEKLAEGFEIFVNDAFSVCHRDQASVTGVAKLLPAYAGFRLQKEIETMEKIKSDFKRPAIAIIGGAKIETKLPVIKFFEEKYDNILVGGKIANEALDQKIQFGKKVVLPFDFVDEGMDIGPKTLEKFEEIIKSAETIVWNGPTGKFEEKKYAVSTNKILESILQSYAFCVVGGGETIEVLEENKAVEKISFVSTGGGAMLEYLSGNKMPGIEALKA